MLLLVGIRDVGGLSFSTHDGTGVGLGGPGKRKILQCPLKVREFWWNRVGGDFCVMFLVVGVRDVGGFVFVLS